MAAAHERGVQVLMRQPLPAKPQEAHAPRQRRGWAWAAVTAVGLSIAAGGVWAWAQSEGSLASALRALAWALPGTQQLHVSQVSGSVRHGGHLDQMRWQEAGLEVQAQGLDMALDWTRLWQGQLPLQKLQMQQLRVIEQRPAQAATPLTQVTLPLQVDLPWQVQQLQWSGALNLQLSNLQGQYRYDGLTHTLQLLRLDMAQGRYHGQATVQATAPMAINARLQGEVSTSVPVGAPSWTLQAQAQLQGTLAGPEAQVQLQAQVAPAQAMASAMQLQLDATLLPQQSQSVSSLQLQASRVDLASLWPNAPRTQLSGQVRATPQGKRWQMRGALTNALPGPWDRQRLPLQELRLDIDQEDAHWIINSLDMAWPGGGAQIQGQWQATGWQGQARVEHLQTAQVHSTLSGPALSGTLKATQAQAGRVQFEALLQPTGALVGAPAGESASLKASGEWTRGLWKFDQLEMRLAQALLQGHGQWQIATSSLTGQWTWAWPGLQGKLSGRLAPRDGQGQLGVELQDAQRSLQWLQRWPSLKAALSPWQAQGQAQLSAQWQGGWQQPDTSLRMRLEAPQLQVSGLHMGTWQSRSAQVQIEGTRQSLQARMQAEARHPQGIAQLDTRWQMQPPAAQVHQKPWRGQWEEARLQWISGVHKAQMQLQAPMDWQWAVASGAVQWSPSTWQLSGPSPGQAWLQIERGDWSPADKPMGKGHLAAHVDGLPWQWAQALGWPDNQGDLQIKGSLRIALEDQLTVQARLERSRGRLLINADGNSAPPLDAGIQDAFAQLSIQGHDAQLQLQWHTARAGQLQALLKSRVDTTDPAGLWSAQAPVSGQVTAHLPRMGVWSWLAPPGWRVHGALDAAVDVTGTRGQPRWSGQLRAENLAVRSAVQGLEFSQGQLRARLQDQKMVLEQFSLKGAGAQGGEVSAQGQVSWTQPDSTRASLNDVQMAMQITARGLRVSNRADRRLTVSGQVKGQMKQGQLELNGQLKADQALFILQDDTTPTLGDDVVVLRPHMQPDPAAPATPRTWMDTPDIRILLDLGPDFQVQGQGLSTRLAGQVTLVSNAASQGLPRLTGQVSTESGRFKAYGQQLNIAQGLLRFKGPYDNPDLEILALRPNLSQRVGVTVTGTALAPRIRLYADPDMPDADKLAWLVLGRSPAGGGAESAVLQQAALALLGGNGKPLGGDLANALGLDELSVASGSRSATTATTGMVANTATGAAITLGKRLSKDFYLVYESSLSGAFGSLYVFYDLSRRLTLRAQAGDVNALDLVYTVRKD
jgi:translocation and assembly module TamB